MGARRGESWPLLLLSGVGVVLFVLTAVIWVTRWRRQRERQP